MTLFQELRDSAAIEKLRLIYNLSDTGKLTSDEKRDIDYILDRLDVLAVLVAEGIVNRKLAIDVYGGAPAMRCWYRLHQYIKDTRDERGYFGDNIESFVRTSLDYFDRMGIHVKFCYWDGMLQRIVDLTQVLDTEPFRPRCMKQIESERRRT